MKAHTEYLTFRTARRKEMVHITDQVEAIVRRSGVQDGLCFVSPMHITAAIYVNEETRDRANNPGKAAIASVAMLAAIYSLATLSFQAVLRPDELQAHAGDALSAVSARLLHGPWGALMALVVLLGTLATLQAAVVSAARMGLAMSRDRVMPAFFGRMRANGSTPWAATLTMSAVNLALLALALGTTTTGAALTNAASSLGLSLRTHLDLGSRHGQACALNYLGELAGLTMATEESRERHGRALAIARDLGAPLEEARALEGMGRSYLHSDPGEATAHLRRALAIYQRIGNPGALRTQAALDELGHRGP